LVVEPPAAALLSSQKSKKALAGIKKALEDEAAAMEDPVAFGHAAARFHEQVVELAGNHTLAIFAAMLADIIDRHTTQLLRDAATTPTQPEQVRRAHRAHEKLVQLIEKGNTQQAEAHWRSHMESLGQWFLDGDGAKKLVEFYT
ncbi:MAG: FadR/GntR family transcriptional regulator, partial [Actinomycetota bacterium]